MSCKFRSIESTVKAWLNHANVTVNVRFDTLRLTKFCINLIWFTANPVDKNTFGDSVEKICNKAGIEGQTTNQSIRATAATRGLVKGIPEKVEMERTGHRDVRSLQKYQRPDVSAKVEYYKMFDWILTKQI